MRPIASLVTPFLSNFMHPNTLLTVMVDGSEARVLINTGCLMMLADGWSRTTIAVNL